MMFFTSISALFLLFYSASQQVTTCTAGDDCCDNFITTDSPAASLLPSENFVVRASCSCVTNNISFCPMIVVGEEAKEFISLKSVTIEETRNICVVQATIKPLQSKFNKHSIEVLLTVNALENQRSLSARFQKSDNEEECKEDVDCWHSWDQICDHGRCSCYNDVPSFVKIEGRCFTASKYGESCIYDEQCMSEDSNTICCDEHSRCKCKDGYRTRSDSDPTCITEPTNTTTPEPTTTTTTGTTTESPSPTLSPVGDCCDDLVAPDPPTTPLLPTESFVINASCSCKTNNLTFCPVVDGSEEAMDFASFHQDVLVNAGHFCVVQVTIKPLQSKFNKRSIEVPFTVRGHEKLRPLTVRFQKSDDGEKCEEDLDCWHSWDQMCDNKRCTCYRDVPSFVKIEGKCFTASKYGENCKYDEQCWSSDNHTICNDDHRRCKCIDGYWAKSDSDPTCITGFSAKVIANQFLVYFTAISSVIFFSRMK